MIKKNFYIFVILLFSHCGFEPVYNSNNVNYKINIVETKGDKTINNTLISEIKRISDSSATKIFNIKVSTAYEKIIISKDVKGSASDYQLFVKTNFEIIFEDNTEIITYQEKQNIKKNLNYFDQKNYEDSIKKSFATSFIKQLNIELLSK